MRRITLPERPGWRDQARAAGFGFHEMYGEPYWVDDAAYAFTLEQIERDIEAPSEELHEMALALVGDVVDDEQALERLCIPRDRLDLVRDSWKRGDPHLYGRFDLAYDGTGPAKLLEYNADTPTSIFEAAYFQHNWLVDRIEAGQLPDTADQFNFLQESLIEAFATAFASDRIFHFACWTQNEEDRGTAVYLMDCAVQAGHHTELIDIRDIGVDPQGRFTDTADRTIDRCFKLYPWEDMFREPFAAHLKPGVFIEPLWKAILSNKAMLPLLWEKHPGHPNLLPAFFEGDPRSADLARAVSKPVFSREGENVTLLEGGKPVVEAGGDYGEERRIVQDYAPLFAADGQHAVLGSWMIGDRAAGLGLREDTTRITRNLSRFVPHFIEGS
ncbi:glutathionylspermidine synthase family protein [Altericroceibacterium xinjiangense]|uniref:glutathionylspermidine synthase family protein n=1 Tax=Altericroceibacterium xinjiangense TaxID=762261 RepID=UPI000F7E030C|nr:glutathionylspermidine synthase family protein [Altericroceibacterium xinjiangense]